MELLLASWYHALPSLMRMVRGCHSSLYKPVNHEGRHIGGTTISEHATFSLLTYAALAASL